MSEDTEDWFELNRANWDERAAPHAASPGYAVQRFVDDPTFLSPVVRFDVPRLPDLHGLRGLHLQCHIGTDTLSLSRLGARMSGLDFSATALGQARDLAARTGAEIEYVHGLVDDAPALLGEGGFDFVFTGIGALCWLPNIRDWASVVARLLKPGGRLLLREGHPMLWTLDETMPQLTVGWPYFETPEPAVFDEPGTYVETDVQFQHTRSASWNHGLAETITALMDVGLTLTLLEEHRSVPWNALPGWMTLGDDGEYRLVEHPDRVPLSYTLHAVMRG